jgi:hypothetical protein
MTLFTDECWIKSDFEIRPCEYELKVDACIIVSFPYLCASVTMAL